MSVPSVEGTPWMLSRCSQDYLTYSKTHKAPNTFKNFDSPAIASFQGFVGDVPVSSVTPYMIESWKEGLLAMPSKVGVNTTVRMRLRVIKAFFNWLKRLEILLKSPADHISFPPDNTPGRALTPPELSKLYEFLQQIEKKAVLLYISTGLRRSELLELEWNSVKYNHNGPISLTIDPRRTKTRSGRVIPVNHRMASIIESLSDLGPLERSGRLFQIDSDQFERDFRKAALKAGLGRVRIHDLRHTWATRYMEQTGDLPGLMIFGGWSSLASVKKYQHLTQARIENYLKVDFGIGGLSSVKEPGFFSKVFHGLTSSVF